MTNSIEFLNKIVNVKIDRPLGSKHPKHYFTYSVNYGYIPNTVSGYGEELDAYVLGVFEPLETFEGKVIAVNKKDGKVLVEGVNMLTKHTKPSAANQNGGIVHQEGYIDVSNVMYVHKGQPTRVGFKMDGDKKVRFAKKTGEVID